MTSANETRRRAPGSTAVRAAPTAELGGRLRQARLGRNMTQSDLADGQFSVSYISAVERGQIRPSLGALEKLAARLNVATHDLLRTDGGVGVSLDAEFFPLSDRNEVELQLRAAQILTHQGQPREVLGLLDALRARGLSGRDQALVDWQSARCALELKRGEQACKQAQAALDEAEHVNDPEMRERIRLTLGEALTFIGKQQAALSQLRAAADAAQKGTVRDPLFRLRAL
jgi:transcriptional regulator with XRE-family HTH domain